MAKSVFREYDQQALDAEYNNREKVTDSADWLATVDRFGIVSERAVLLEQISAAQNIAMSLTLDIEPMARDVREQVGALGDAVGLDAAALDRPIHGTSVAIRHRIRIARAIAGAVPSSDATTTRF
jgi:ABC-type lipoprotein export system ATPase subunit